MESLWRLRRVDDAIRWGLEAKAALDAIGDTGANSTGSALTGYYAADTGSPDTARELLVVARAYASPDDFAAHVPIGWAAALLASLDGDHDAALAEIGRSLELIRPTDYLTFHAETERVHGKILFAAGRHQEATAAFDAALEMYERKGDVASARRLKDERPDRVTP
jgi:tetratricopeptide (TPR) repeat protein